MGPSRQPTSASPSPEPAAPGRLLGDLARGDSRWSVHLETRPHPKAPPGARATVQGRLVFVDGSRQKVTGWIFVERSEADILTRFHEFSAAELWLIADSLP